MEVEGMSRSAAPMDFSISAVPAAAPKNMGPKKKAVSEGNSAARSPVSMTSAVGGGQDSAASRSETRPAVEGGLEPGAAVSPRQDPQGAAKADDKRLNDRKNDETMAQKAVENADNRMREQQNKVEFSYNDKINRFTITFRSAENDEIIKEVPPEQIQKMLERLHTLSGFMIDTEV